MTGSPTCPRPRTFCGSAAAMIAACLAASAPAHAAAPAEPTGKRQRSEAPRAQAACPVCVPIAVAALRTAAVRAAPVAVRAVSRVGRGTSRARARIRAGARKARAWGRTVRHMTLRRASLLFAALPRYAKGCARGLVDHVRDLGSLTLLRAFYACGRGIVEHYLGKDPLGPIDR